MFCYKKILTWYLDFILILYIIATIFLNQNLNKMKTQIFFLLLMMIEISFSQTFYNKGANVTINDAAKADGNVATDATLYIRGALTNTINSTTIGIIANNGEIQITGDWIQDGSAQLVSTGDEVFIGGNGIADMIYNKYLQRITGNTANAFVGSNYDFNNFIIQKPARTTTNVSIVELGVNVEVSNLIKWAGNGVIRTDIAGHADNGSAYLYLIYLKNGLPSSLTGYNWISVNQWSSTGGATDKYIEGRLKRSVTQAATYDFPIGVAPTSLDGMEPFSITFTSAPTNTLLGYIQPATTINYLADLITNGSTLFYDIGSLPAVSPMNQFPNCVGLPDGYDDVAVIDQAVNYEWITVLDNAIPVAYTFQAHPGSVMDNIAYVSMGVACNTTYKKAKYIGLNGRIGGNQAIGPTTNTWVPGISGLYQQPTGNILTNQIAFGKFRLFGTINTSNTSLPVELVTFNGRHNNNRNVLLWETASEYNTNRFEIYKSLDGSSNWTYLGSVRATGNSTSVKNYTSYDNTPVIGNNYYKLKIIDNDSTFNYSIVINIPIPEVQINGFAGIYPNPTKSNITVEIGSSSEYESTLSIVNILGEPILTKNITIHKGANYMPIDLTNFANTLYFISFPDMTGAVHLQKVTKQ